MNGRLIVLWLLIICIATGAAGKTDKVRRPNCTAERVFGCTRLWRPVCGSNGITYANTCLLCKKIRESRKSILITKDRPCDIYG